MKSGHHCCPLPGTPRRRFSLQRSPSARIIRQSSQPEASACCCSGCSCPLHSGTAPSAALAAATAGARRRNRRHCCGLVADQWWDSTIPTGTPQLHALPIKQRVLPCTHTPAHPVHTLHPPRSHQPASFGLFETTLPSLSLCAFIMLSCRARQNLGATCNNQTPVFTVNYDEAAPCTSRLNCVEIFVDSGCGSSRGSRRARALLNKFLVDVASGALKYFWTKCVAMSLRQKFRKLLEPPPLGTTRPCFFF